MKIIVKVRFGSSKQNVEPFGNSRYLVKVISVMNDPNADSELIGLLSKYLGVPPSRVQLVSGRSGTDRIFEIS